MPNDAGPATIPAVDFDHHDASQSAHQVRAKYEEVRAKCPVAHVDGYGGFELISGFSEVRAVINDKAFVSSDGIFIPASGLPPIPALEHDGEDHDWWRGLMAGLLTPAAVRELEPMVLEVVDQQIDAFAETGQVDLVPAFSHPVPGIVIGRLVGLDMSASLESQRLADTFFAAIGTPTFSNTFSEFAAFTMEHLNDRRKHPRDDFLSHLASGHYQGAEITDDIALQLFIALLGGGHHSTASALSGLLLHVVGDPAVREQILEDPRTCLRAIDESIRLTTPLQLFARTALVDSTVGGFPVSSGSRVMLNYAAANRDPEEFEQPDQFSLERRRNRHVAFGGGLHVCVGQHLARLELRVALNRLLERLPDIQLTGEPTSSGLVAGQLMALRSLPASFTPVKPR